jgi:hypothetical protein
VHPISSNQRLAVNLPSLRLPLQLVTVAVLATSPVMQAQCLYQEQVKLIASDATTKDVFGFSVSADGDRVVSGAYRADGPGGAAGAAYIYRATGGSWVEEQKLVSSDLVLNDQFGIAVALSGTVAVIGAQGDDDNGASSGSAYVFSHDGTSWVEADKLTASDGAASDFMGNAVAVSGNVAMVGANLHDTATLSNAGACYVYRFDGTNWPEEQILTASDLAADDRFGGAVSVDANLCAVGACLEDPGGVADAGSVYVFQYNGTTWSEIQKLTASDAQATDHFGASVSIRGDLLIVGATDDDDLGNNAGAVYVFRDDGTQWNEVQKLTTADGAPGQQLGLSVSGLGNTCLVGHGLGSAYVFVDDGTSWSEQQKERASDPSINSFGESVSLTQDIAIIGAFKDRNAGTDTGAAYIFTIDPFHRSVGTGLAGTGGVTPTMAAVGSATLGSNLTLEVRDFVGGASSFLVVGSAAAETALFGGTLYVDLAAPFRLLPMVLPGTPGVAGDGDLDYMGTIVNHPSLDCLMVHLQAVAGDAAAPSGLSMSNGVRVHPSTH